MKYLPLSALLAAGLLAGCHSKPVQSKAPLPVTPTTNASESVGTYRRTELLVAFYASTTFQSQLQGLREERDAALAKGDTAAAQSFERQGEALQELAHQQLAGKALLDNVMAALKDAIPVVQKELGVTRLVEETEEVPAGVKAVDATAALTTHLPRSPRVARPR
jgi:hypothetical protein